ncbi:MAG: hypothetical protein U0165_07940 [Polyangiaceae bacterium]
MSSRRASCIVLAGTALTGAAETFVERSSVREEGGSAVLDAVVETAS